MGAADAARSAARAPRSASWPAPGMPVPRGFVVTTAAFGLHMDAARPGRRGPRGARVAGRGRPRPGSRRRGGLRARVIGGAAAARGRRTRSRPALCGARRPAAVAVRSSATLEDSAEASFAGLQDTYLAVRGADAVLDRVRALLGQPVQRRVDRLPAPPGHPAKTAWPWRWSSSGWSSPRSAGVMFTRSPVTGDRSVVAIEGSLGARLGPGRRRGDAGQLRGQQGDRRDHRAAGRRQAAGPFMPAERSGDLRRADGGPAAADRRA